MIHRSTHLRCGAALLLGSLLVLVMVAPAAADHVSVDIEISLDNTGTLTPGKNASITVSGTVTCAQDGWVIVSGLVSQRKGPATTAGYYRTDVYCTVADGSAAWEATATTSEGHLGKGPTTLVAIAYSYAQEAGAKCDPDVNWETCYYDSGSNTYYHYAYDVASSQGPITIT